MGLFKKNKKKKDEDKGEEFVDPTDSQSENQPVPVESDAQESADDKAAEAKAKGGKEKKMILEDSHGLLLVDRTFVSTTWVGGCSSLGLAGSPLGLTQVRRREIPAVKCGVPG